MPYDPAPRILQLSSKTSPTVPVLSPTSRHDDAIDASAAELKTLMEDAMMVMIKTTRLVLKMMSMMSMMPMQGKKGGKMKMKG